MLPRTTTDSPPPEGWVAYDRPRGRPPKGFAPRIAQQDGPRRRVRATGGGAVARIGRETAQTRRRRWRARSRPYRTRKPRVPYSAPPVASLPTRGSTNSRRAGSHSPRDG